MVLWLVKLPSCSKSRGLAQPGLPVLIGTALVEPGAMQRPLDPVLWRCLLSGGLSAPGSERLPLWPWGPVAAEAPSIAVFFFVGGLRDLAAAVGEWQAVGGDLTLLCLRGPESLTSSVFVVVVK